MLWTLVACAVAVPLAAGQSLYIPGFDSQPVSVSNLGVDSQGRTSWEVVPIYTDTEDSLALTATLVEGPNDAEINAALGPLSLAESCTLQNGIAVCVATEVEPAVTNIVTATETIIPISVMVASGTATSAAQPASGASGSSNSIPSNTAAASSSASASGSAVNPSASAANSGGRNLAQSSASLSVMAGLVLCMVVL